MKKLYGLEILKSADGAHTWSAPYLFSDNVEKLKAAAVLPEKTYWYAHRSKVSRTRIERSTVTHTTNYDLEELTDKLGPYYKIVEVPFII